MDSPFGGVFLALCRRLLFCYGIEMEIWNWVEGAKVMDE